MINIYDCIPVNLLKKHGKETGDNPSKLGQVCVRTKCNLSVNCQKNFNSIMQYLSLSLVLVALCNQHRVAMLVKIRHFEEEKKPM